MRFRVALASARSASSYCKRVCKQHLWCFAIGSVVGLGRHKPVEEQQKGQVLVSAGTLVCSCQAGVTHLPLLSGAPLRQSVVDFGFLGFAVVTWLSCAGVFTRLVRHLWHRTSGAAGIGEREYRRQDVLCPLRLDQLCRVAQQGVKCVTAYCI